MCFMGNRKDSKMNTVMAICFIGIVTCMGGLYLAHNPNTFDGLFERKAMIVPYYGTEANGDRFSGYAVLGGV